MALFIVPVGRLSMVKTENSYSEQTNYEVAPSSSYSGWSSGMGISNFISFVFKCSTV